MTPLQSCINIHMYNHTNRQSNFNLYSKRKLFIWSFYRSTTKRADLERLLSCCITFDESYFPLSQLSKSPIILTKSKVKSIILLNLSRKLNLTFYLPQSKVLFLACFRLQIEKAVVDPEIGQEVKRSFHYLFIQKQPHHCYANSI